MIKNVNIIDIINVEFYLNSKVIILDFLNNWKKIIIY